jgi:serine protease AprX
MSFHTSAGRLRRYLLLLLLGPLVLLATGAAAQSVRVGPSLTSALAVAGPADRLQVIVTFEGDGPLDAEQLGLLDRLGLGGVYFRNLPIAGVLATPDQVRALATSAGVRSVWHNDRLEYDNDYATALTGVDRLRTDPALRTSLGLPFSGRGVGVLVNDSGVDGLHRDLQYPNHVVQNVLAQTNLHAQDAMLPVTYVENVPNSDIGAGHGTHVAGIIGGTGAQSGGRYEGVAPGANIVGYGSGAALFILDTIGGFDYALTNQVQYNIRVISNSFGNTGDVGTPFDPADPTNVATKACADRGMVVVFSAGNSGSGPNTITGNFKKAPWVIAVAAGDASGLLADFSSRGNPGGGETAVEVDGETYTWADRPTVTAPGVAIVSARASTGDSAPDTGLEPAYIPYYVTLDGTSMACPHVSGIVALVLEAAPGLNVYQVKRLLEQTATNMPGRERWEAGAGYVNAYAAVESALGRSARPFGSTVNVLRTFNSNALVSQGAAVPFSIDYLPVGATEEVTFEVAADVSRVTAQAQVSDNTVALVLYDPAGNRYGSSISLPVLGENIAASAPGMAGTWRLTVRGVGSVSGVPTDPLGLTNGTSLPGTVAGQILMSRTGGYTGLSDIAGHPAAADVQYGVFYRLVDGYPDGTFRPNAALTRGELAQYLTMGAGVRQFFRSDRTLAFGDVSATLSPFVEAATARGAALRNTAQNQNGLIRTAGGPFNAGGQVTRADLAYALVQALGLQDRVASYTGAVTVAVDGQRIAVRDADQIPAGLRGYVQAALDLNVINARFVLQQGPFDLRPTLVAYFDPGVAVKRGDYAVYAGRFFDNYLNGFELPSSAAKDGTALTGGPVDARSTAAFALEQNWPNPATGSTAIRFSLSTAADVRLAVYDMTGREVARLVEGAREAGTHEVRWEALGVAAGAYVYRLQAGNEVASRRMVVVR